jgi:hypothetical protein
MTADTYGHLFPSTDAHNELAEAEKKARAARGVIKILIENFDQPASGRPGVSAVRFYQRRRRVQTGQTAVRLA